MTEIVSDWLHFDNRAPKRKRAEQVCSACHAKKGIFALVSIKYCPNVEDASRKVSQDPDWPLNHRDEADTDLECYSEMRLAEKRP